MKADWLSARARASPERIGLIFEGESWTFAALDRLVDAWAGRLAARRVAPGDRVGVLLPNRPDFVLLVYAIARAGAVLLPLNIRLTPAELHWQADRAGCRLLLCDATTAAAAAPLEGEQRRVISIDLLDSDDAQGPSQARSWDLDALQGIVFTSGTSGRPKGTELTFGNHFWSALASATRLGLDVDDRWLTCLPLYHVGGLAILFRSVLYGTTIDLYPRFELARISAALDHDPVTLISLVPTMVHRLLDAREGRRWTPALRHVLIGGAAAQRDLLDRCRQAQLPVSTTYGLTEAASQVATLTAPAVWARPGSVGRPLLFTEVEIRNEADRPVPAGVRGEVVVRGPTVMRGYVGDAAATARTLRDGWLHTGDLGYLDDDGNLWLVQRRSDLIVSGGENVYPAEVEEVLRQYPAVADACVVGLPDPEWGQQVAALVARHPGAELETTALQAFARERLAGYKLPRRLRVVDALPQTASGKVARQAVAAALAEL